MTTEDEGVGGGCVRVQCERGGKISAGEALKGKIKGIKANRWGRNSRPSVSWKLHLRLVNELVKVHFGLWVISLSYSWTFFFLCMYKSASLPSGQLVYICVIPPGRCDSDYVMQSYS